MQDLINSVTERCKETHEQSNWSGSFTDYLKLVSENPSVARNAFQRVYDMIMSYGVDDITEHKNKITRYRFFSDERNGGRDAVYCIDQSLAHLVDIFKSAAQGYGTEKRVILLHGPVGSAKSTIVRLVKKGLQEYSKTKEGAIYTFVWKNEGEPEMMCPMREDPLKLIPSDQRGKIFQNLFKQSSLRYAVCLEGDLCPACRQMYRELFVKYKGDWS